jgi:hypothetical protein
MKIGDKIVIMRDKYYGLTTRGRYNQAKIGTLVDRDYNEPASFAFDIGGEQIIGTQQMYGAITFPDGWHLIFKETKLPYEDMELSENLAKYVESNRNTLIFHVGAQIENYTLGNAIMKVTSSIGMDMYDDISRMPIALNKINAKAGSLIACTLRKEFAMPKNPIMLLFRIL